VVVRPDAVPTPSAAPEKRRLKIARAILGSLTRTPHQNRTKVITGVSGDEKSVRRVFLELVDAGIITEVKTGERVNNKGEVEAVLVYEVAPLSAAVVEARLKEGLVE